MTWEFHPRPQTKPVPSRVIIGASKDGLNGKYLTLEGKTSELIKILKPGQRMEQLYEQVHGKGKKAYFAFSRLHPDKPAYTIAKDSAGLIHWEHNRTLTIGEYKRIASFTDDFQFLGSFNMALKRVGNSVPPNLMKAIAENIREAPFMKGIEKPTVVSTFAGCGGSSLGYQLAGFHELLAVEWDQNAVDTFRLNFPDVPVYHGDIAKLTGGECMRLAGIEKGALDVLDGSPPCQGFSTAGKRKFDDPRNSLFKEYARLLSELQPKIFVMENVTGMVKGCMKQAYLSIIKTLRECGYRAKGEILNAMYFNVPQSRERVIIIGVREDLGIEPSHPKPSKKPITVRQALKGVDVGDYPVIKGKWAEIGKRLPQGETGEYFAGKGHGYGIQRLHWDKPSPTIRKTMASSGWACLIHPEEPRVISINEAKRLCSFPDDFIFEGKTGDMWQRIGNSVPPNLGFHIAKHIKSNILEKVINSPANAVSD